jgi:hypothetical protein
MMKIKKTNSEGVAAHRREDDFATEDSGIASRYYNE